MRQDSGFHSLQHNTVGGPTLVHSHEPLPKRPLPGQPRAMNNSDSPFHTFIGAPLDALCELRGATILRSQDQVPSVEQWLNASVVLLDENSVGLCLRHGLPQRPSVFLTTSSPTENLVDAARLGVTETFLLPDLARSLAQVINSLLLTSTRPQVLTISGPGWPLVDDDPVSERW